MDNLRQRLQRIRNRVADAALAVGRDPAEVMILAVSKTFPVETILQAVDAGQRFFGENRVQEAESKIPLITTRERLEWHLVGHLQSNKTRRAVELFDVIHSVDSVRLATRISEASLAHSRRTRVLVQVDLGHEATKFGAAPEDVPAIVSAAADLKGILVDGLMTIPPFLDDPDDVRPYFARLRELRDSMQAQVTACLGSGQLSMGMSHDFEAAVREGATIVRIGTAIFGERT